MRRLAVTLTVATASVLAVGSVSRSDAASASSTKADQTIPLLSVGVSYSRSTLDPGKTQGGISVEGLERLFTFRPDGSVKPHLAKSVRQPNRLTYIYTLRRGIKFWNGNELTAADVANALNYQRHPSLQTSSHYASVRDIRATGRYTVVVTLKRPNAAWPTILATQGAIFEKKFADEHRGTFGEPGVLTMGTGPWRVVSLDPTRGMELSANPNYWGGRPRIQRISYKFFSDETSLALAVRAGEIHVAFPGDPRTFAATSGMRVVSVPSCSEAYFSMNTRRAPWNDVHVRRAVAYAINRADIIKALGGFATPVSTFIPPSQLRSLGSQADVNALLKSVPAYQFSLAKARQEMARSAHPNGFSASTITIDFGNFPEVTQVIAANLRRIGIDLKINRVSFAEWGSALYGPKDQLEVIFTWLGCTSPDPSYYPAFLLGSKNARAGAGNIANYAKTAVDDLIQDGVRATDRAKRRATYERLLKVLALDVPYAPIYVRPVSVVLSRQLTWPTFNAWTWLGLWPQEIRPRS